MQKADFEFDYELLKELTEASGVPGYEDKVRSIVRRELGPPVDELRGDEMGNVIGTLHGETDYEVIISAHLDEIGFLVRHVDDKGFIKLTALGGWDARIMRAQRVTVHTENGDLTGVIGSPPPSTQNDVEEETTNGEDMRVDLGLDSESVSEQVSVGASVTMKQRTEVVGEHVMGKALDDRVCVFTMLEAAQRIEDPIVTIHLAATVQEEVGLRGAEALSVDVDPDLAVALDVTIANDIPEFSEGEQVSRLGEGAAIKVKDSSVITNPKVHRRL